MAGLDRILAELHKKFTAKGMTLSIAESCTGGLVSATITDYPGASSYFWGGVVSYDNSAKEELLGVPSETLEEFGAVSQETALKMAKGVRSRLKTAWSLAITGIAGPTGGTPEKPVGTVWFSIVGPDVEWSDVKKFEGDRRDIRTASMKYVLETLLEKLSNNKE